MHAIPLDPARVADPRTPIVFIVDDPAPVAHVFRCHWIDVHKTPPVTKDGRPLLEDIPNSVLTHFADVIQRCRNTRGHFTACLVGDQRDALVSLNAEADFHRVARTGLEIDSSRAEHRHRHCTFDVTSFAR
jgi:hypothetical protein